MSTATLMLMSVEERNQGGMGGPAACPANLPRVEDAGARGHDAPSTLTGRRTAVADTAGALTGVYAVDELNRLRDDWPA